MYLTLFLFVGMEGIIKKLNSDKDKGITPEYNEQRKVAFGSNDRDPKVADTCCSMFKSALDDFMLKLLAVCAVVSVTVDMSMVEHAEEYAHGKYHFFNHLSPCRQG
jgi:hypothetical protein